MVGFVYWVELIGGFCFFWFWMNWKFVVHEFLFVFFSCIFWGVEFHSGFGLKLCFCNVEFRVSFVHLHCERELPFYQWPFFFFGFLNAGYLLEWECLLIACVDDFNCFDFNLLFVPIYSCLCLLF